MYLSKINKNGRLYLAVLESYRNSDGRQAKRSIMTIGYLDQTGHDLAYYEQLVVKMNQDKKEEAFQTVRIDMNAPLLSGNNFLNVGYFALKYIYLELGLPAFLSDIQKRSDFKWSLNKNLELLVFSRILYPASKLSTFDNRNIFFEGFEKGVTRDSMYDCLDVLAANKEKIERLLYKNTRDQYNRDTSTTYYDCTNFYFEIEYNDEDVVDDEGNIIRNGLRKRGPEKNKRPDPIVEMGLLMDSDGIPLAYNIFPGNESEKLSLRPVTSRVRRDYGIERTIVVADRGLNTSDNIFFLAGKNEERDNPRDGYVYGQSVRGASTEFKEWVLDEEGYKVDIVEEDKEDNEGKEKIAFTHKSRVIAREIKILKDGKRKVKVNVCQKQMVYFSFKYMMKQRYERQKMIEKAEKIVKNPQAYTRATSYGAAYYIDNIAFDKETGEIKTDLQLTVNYEKMAEEEKYDGYYAIVTSEIEYDDYKIRKIYRGLAKIEESFKVTKSYLKSRPVFVWTPEHIKGHFLICFVALVITRLLEKRLGNRYSILRIIESLKKYSCVNIDTNTYQFLYRDEITDALAEEFGVELNRKYRTRDQIKKLLRYK